MENNLHSTYVLKALDAYPYNLEETLEALNYALSYNSHDVHALCLMGRLFAEQLEDYETAKQYYVEALVVDLNAHYVYPNYLYALIRNEDYSEVEKVLKHALTIKAVDKALLYMIEGQYYEAQGKYELSIRSLKRSKLKALNNEFVDFISEEISRVKKKSRINNSKEEPVQKDNKKRMWFL